MTDDLEARIEALEAAVLSLATSSLEEFVGDLPGHPFRGNQYSGGLEEARAVYDEARRSGAGHEDALDAVYSMHGSKAGAAFEKHLAEREAAKPKGPDAYPNGGGQIRPGHEVTLKGERGSFIVKAPYIGASPVLKDGTIRVERRDPAGGTKSHDGRNVTADQIKGRVHEAELTSITHQLLQEGKIPKGDKVRLIDPATGRVTETVTA